MAQIVAAVCQETPLHSVFLRFHADESLAPDVLCPNSAWLFLLITVHCSLFTDNHAISTATGSIFATTFIILFSTIPAITFSTSL